MGKLKIEDLKKIQEETRRSTFLREGKARAKVIVHMGTCGIAAGARGILSAFMDEVVANNIDDVIITNSGCAGMCSHEPMATVELKDKPPVKYIDLTKEKVHRIFNEHILGGNIVYEFALAIGSEQTDKTG